MADNLERPERLQVMLNAEEFIALDTWRFQKRMPSRAAAVRELLRRGLAAEGFLEADNAPILLISESWTGARVTQKAECSRNSWLFEEGPRSRHIRGRGFARTDGREVPFLSQ